MPRNGKDDDGNGTSMASLARYLGLAAMLPLSAFAGYVIGEFLDRNLGTHFLQMTCVVLFIVGSFVQLLRELLREDQ